MSGSRRWLRGHGKKRSELLFARSISRPSHEESCELLKLRSLHREDSIGGKRLGFVRDTEFRSEAGAAAGRRWLCSSKAWRSPGNAAMESLENHSKGDAVALQRNRGMSRGRSITTQHNAAIASMGSDIMPETFILQPTAAMKDGNGETLGLQQTAAMANGSGETSILKQKATVASMESKNMDETLVNIATVERNSMFETLHQRLNAAMASTANSIRGVTLIPRDNDVMESLEDSPNFKQEGELMLEKSEGKENAESHLNIEDVDKVSMRVLAPQDTQIIQGICNLLDSKGWEAFTEAFLEEHYSMHLSHFNVARVILRQRSVALATSFFQWACKQIGHEVCSYHAYLMKLGEVKHFDEMWELLNEMRDNGCQVTRTTFCIMIKAYGAARMPSMAVDVLRRVHEYNVTVDTHVYTTLLNVFFLSNLVGEARLCFSRMLEDDLNLDTYAFSTLIRGFGLSWHIRDAQSCFDIMLKARCEPDVSTYNGLIEGFCCVDAMKDAMSAFSALQKRGLKPTTSTFNIIVRAFCRVGRFDDAINMFASMKTICLPDQSTFNILLQGLFLSKDISKAVDFFKLMEKEGWADARSYIYLSNGLRQAKQTEEMHYLLKTLFAKHGFTNREVCIALLHNLSYLGNLDEAERLFKAMVAALTDPCMPSYAIMISCYCRLEKLNEAIELLTELKGRGCKPSTFCYTPIVGALLKVNRVADAMKCFEEMLEYDLEVNAITCNFLLGELCKQAMVEDALKVCYIVVDNRFAIRSLTFFELMKCLCKLGKIEEANTLFRAMHKLGCLPKSRAISQAFGVMDKMNPSYN